MVCSPKPPYFRQPRASLTRRARLAQFCKSCEFAELCRGGDNGVFEIVEEALDAPWTKDDALRFRSADVQWPASWRDVPHRWPDVLLAAAEEAARADLFQSHHGDAETRSTHGAEAFSVGGVRGFCG
jgi:hypothetical protein